MEKYFMYSSKQLKFRKEIEAKTGKIFKVGHVITKNGTRKPFTEISDTTNSRFDDAIVVAKGDPNTMVYTEPGGD